MSDQLAKCTEIEAEARAFLVHDQATLNQAVAELQSVRQMLNGIHDELDPVVKKSHDAWQANIDLRRRTTAPLETAEACYKQSIAKFLGAEEQKRLTAAREAQAKAEAEEQKRREEEAKALKKAKMPEAAKAVLAQPLQVAIAAPPPAPKVKGVSAKKKYRVDWSRSNIALIPREYLCVNEQKVNGVVRAMGEDTSIPGIVVVEDLVVSVRSAQ